MSPLGVRVEQTADYREIIQLDVVEYRLEYATACVGLEITAVACHSDYRAIISPNGTIQQPCHQIDYLGLAEDEALRRAVLTILTTRETPIIGEHIVATIDKVDLIRVSPITELVSLVPDVV